MPVLSAVGTRVRALWNHPRLGTPVKLIVAYVLFIEVGIQVVFGKFSIFGVTLGRYDLAVPRGEILGGAVIGVLYALVGMGIILVYRANRIINFAQAQLGAVPAVVALLLIAKHGWPYVAAVPVMLVGAVVLGASVEIVFVRRFATAPRLILTVVTIGIGLLLVVLEFYSKQWISGDLIDTLSLTFPTPFRTLRFHVGPSTLTGDHVFAVVVVAILVVALGAFFRFTDIGIAVRASAENAERASLLGIPVKRVSTIVWILAALLSAIGVFLRTPLVGLPLQGSVGPSILLFGLATAVIGRMESLPIAFGGGVLIGVIDRAALFATRRAALANAVMFVVVVIALLAQRGKLSRAMDTGQSTWQVVKEIRPTPAELRNLWEVRAARITISCVGAGIALAGPWIFGSFKTSAATLIVLYAMIGVSLVILTGWAGQISLGQYAISGVGAAVAGGLAANHGWDFFGALFTGALAGAVIAVIVGLPALRIQGLFLAVTTLAFAFTVQNFILRREFFAWLVPKDNSFADRPVLYERWDLTKPSKVLGVTVDGDAKFYFVCLAFLLLVLAMARSLRQLRSGRLLIGVRDNGRVMQSFGVSLASTRLAAFAISGFIAGLAGALIAYQNVVFSPGAFSPEQSISLFVMAVTGGVGSLLGAVLGAAYIVGVPLLPGLRDVELIDLLTSGVGVLIVLLLLPGGFAEGAYRMRDWFLRKIADRHGLVVSSLVADVRVVETTEEDELIVEHAAEHVAEENAILVGDAS